MIFAIVSRCKGSLRRLKPGWVLQAGGRSFSFRPSRPLNFWGKNHRQAIVAGYDRVFDVFVDQRTLERTQEALLGGFSAENREKIQLLPMSKLSELIFNIGSVDGGRVNLPTELTNP